jgi:arylsulfatase
MEGVSLAYTFDHAEAPGRHTTQYFEMFGNRAIYHDGWLAGTVHVEPWAMQPRATLEDDTWELYDTRKDFSLSRDLSAKEPEKLRELQALFLEEATKYHVLPLDDRRAERFDPVLAGRPSPMAGRSSITLTGGMVGFVDGAFPSVRNRSSTVMARVRVDDPTGDGAILAQGGRFGGWSLHLEDGAPVFTYNFLGIERYEVRSPTPLEPGPHTIGWSFAYDGGGYGKGGLGHLEVDGRPVAEGRIDRTAAITFGIAETADVGTDLGTPVTEAYADHPAFPGVVEEVTLERGPPPIGPVTMDER